MSGKPSPHGAEHGLSTMGGLLLISTTILVLGALSWGEMVFAPAAFAIFIVMVVWPLQEWLEARMPKMLAILITTAVTIFCIVALLLLFAWGMGVVGQWLIRNSARFQAIYQAGCDWLEAHGFPVAGQMTALFNVPAVVRLVQAMLSRINGLAGFAMLVFAFAVLGQIEVANFAARLRAAGGRFGGVNIIEVTRETARQFRKYMLVRTIASGMTGAIVWIIASVVGLDHPAAWAAIAFTPTIFLSLDRWSQRCCRRSSHLPSSSPFSSLLWCSSASPWCSSSSAAILSRCSPVPHCRCHPSQ